MKLNYSYLLSLFFVFGIISCDKNNSSNVSSNTENRENDSLILKDLLNQTIQFVENNQTDSARIKATILSKSSNNYYAGKSNSALGYLKLINGDHDSAYFYFNKAKDFFYLKNDSINAGKVLGNMAIIQSNQGDYSGSEVVAIEALNFVENNNNISFKSSIYNCLAISSDALHNHNEAIYWHNKAIETVTDSLNKKIYANNIAVSYLHLEDYKNSESILFSLINDSIVLLNADLKSKVIDNLAFVKWKQNPEINVENELNKALQIRIENNDIWGQIASNSHLSEYFLDKNSKTALFHAHQMLTAATEINSPDDRLEALQKLISLETPDKSKKYAIQYASLNDSLITARNQVKDKFAKIRYDSEKNREENHSLKLKDVESQLQIQRQRNTNIIALSGVAVAFISALFIYYQQKNKRKRERLIATYESEVRISKKIHDVLSNDIYRFILKLQKMINQNNLEKESLIDEIETIYQTSREISREFKEFDTNNSYNHEIKSLLSSYQSDYIKVIYNLLDDEAWEKVSVFKKKELYRVLQEIMTNMAKHSQASHVLLQFKKENGKVEIIYRDNGKGFNVKELMVKSGLSNTENRMESIDGSIIFESNIGKGLTIEISFPS